MTTQGSALATLGVVADRPALGLATEDPAEYVRRLGEAGAAAELTAPGGFGDFYWVVSAHGGVEAGLS